MTKNTLGMSGMSRIKLVILHLKSKLHKRIRSIGSKFLTKFMTKHPFHKTLNAQSIHKNPVYGSNSGDTDRINNDSPHAYTYRIDLYAYITKLFNLIASRKSKYLVRGTNLPG